MDKFVVRMSSNVIGTLTVSTGGNCPNEIVNLYGSDVDASNSLVTCSGTIDAGVFACALSGRMTNGDSAGANAAAPAWNVELVSSVHGVVKLSVQHQSQGTFAASSSVTKSGVVRLVV